LSFVAGGRCRNPADLQRFAPPNCTGRVRAARVTPARGVRYRVASISFDAIGFYTFGTSGPVARLIDQT
jgi:hypothetical protein